MFFSVFFHVFGVGVWCKGPIQSFLEGGVPPSHKSVYVIFGGEIHGLTTERLRKIASIPMFGWLTHLC